MTTAVSTEKKPLSRMDMFSMALARLSPKEIARTEAVSHAWKRTIDSSWQIMHDQLKISVVPIEEHQKKALLAYSGGQFSETIMQTIVAYAAKTCKELVCGVQRADIHFNMSWLLCKPAKDSVWVSGYDWGNNETEPFVGTSLFGSTYVEQMKKELKLEWALGWSSADSNELIKLAKLVPLRFFIDRMGNYKNTGDTISLLLSGRHVIFKCQFLPEHIYDGYYAEMKWIKSFKQALEIRIQKSINDRLITQQDIDRSKELAQQAGDWLVVNKK